MKKLLIPFFLFASLGAFAQIKVSALPSATNAAGGIIPMVQNNVTKKITTETLLAGTVPVVTVDLSGVQVGYIPVWNGTKFVVQAQSGGGGGGVSPAPPTSGIVDNTTKTFNWTNSVSTSNLSDYEYTANAGSSYLPIPGKPITEIGAQAIGSFGVRVKSLGINPASSTLYNASAFTASGGGGGAATLANTAWYRYYRSDTLVTTSGSDITAIRDAAHPTDENFVLNTTVAVKPILTTGAQNGFPAIELSTVNSQIYNRSAVTLNAPITIISVVKLTVLPTDVGFLTDGSQGGAGAKTLISPTGTAGEYVQGGAGYGATLLGTTAYRVIWTEYTTIGTATYATSYIDNVKDLDNVLIDNSSPGYGYLTGFGLGSTGNNGYTQRSKILMSATKDAILNTADRTSIYNSIKAKYAL